MPVSISAGAGGQVWSRSEPSAPGVNGEYASVAFVGLLVGGDDVVAPVVHVCPDVLRSDSLTLYSVSEPEL